MKSISELNTVLIAQQWHSALQEFIRQHPGLSYQSLYSYIRITPDNRMYRLNLKPLKWVELGLPNHSETARRAVNKTHTNFDSIQRKPSLSKLFEHPYGVSK